MKRQIADGWHRITGSIEVYTESGYIIRATHGDRPASVYRWNKSVNSYVNACPMKYETFRKGWKEGRFSIQ